VVVLVVLLQGGKQGMDLFCKATGDALLFGWH
jgi:hypothetical protein